MAGRIWVMDRAAYVERRTIMEIECVDSLTASREASDCGYRTKLSEVATDAANGNWEPAREWCAKIAARFGQRTADELVSEIDANIEAAMAWRPTRRL